MKTQLIQTIPIPDHKMLKVLKRKVFKYDSSEADERFFRERIADFFRGLDYQIFLDSPGSWYDSGGKSFKDHLYSMSHERNGGGVTLKYMYFNERRQRVYLDNMFYEWAVLAAKMIYRELKKINQNDDRVTAITK